jgi:chromosome segregation ATPase
MRTEILSEITSITTEIGTNVLTIGEIVGVVQNQEEVIKQLTQELNETKLLFKKNSDHTNAQLNYLNKEFKGAIKNLNETQVDMAELETTIGNQSNVIEAQIIELNDLKQGFKGIVKDLNETQVDVAELEITNYEFQIELKGIQDNQDKIEFVPIIILKLYMGYFCIMKNVKKFRTKIKQL